MARTSYWPMALTARSAAGRGSSGNTTGRRAAGSASARLKPNASACLRNASSPRWSPILANAVLHEMASAWVTVAVPPKHGNVVVVVDHLVGLGRSSISGAGHLGARVCTHRCRAPRQTTNLEQRTRRVDLLDRSVEQRFSGFLRKLGRSTSTPSSESCEASWLGSNDGDDAIARTAPVCGSSATTAPGLSVEPVERSPLGVGVEGEDDVAALAAVGR